MINVNSLNFNYKNIPIFENFNWSVRAGDSWVVLGPSGCGKSTLLSLLAGLRFAASGIISINNEPITRPRPRTGLILQDYGLLPWATVRQNVGLGLAVRTFYGADGIHAPRTPSLESNVDYWLDRLGLNEVASKFPGQISGGQRQRTAIARTLVLKPNLLLMDEPFSSLDTPTREALQSLTRGLIAEQGMTLIMVTHSIDEAVLLGSNILLLNEPPNRVANTFNNPLAGTPAHRESKEYQSLCRELRMQMGLMLPLQNQESK